MHDHASAGPAVNAGRRRLPVWARPYLFAAVQALVTTGLSTLIATGANARWLGVWSLAWVTIVPIVLLQAPLIGRIVDQCCDAGSGPTSLQPIKK